MQIDDNPFLVILHIIQHNEIVIQVAAAVDGATAILHFTHVGGGLIAKDVDLKGFTITGADRVFHAAQAKIVDGTVVVSAPEVPRPVAVHYGWANVPEENIFNRAGLPAAPFRNYPD